MRGGVLTFVDRLRTVKVSPAEMISQYSGDELHRYSPHTQDPYTLDQATHLRAPMFRDTHHISTYEGSLWVSLQA